MTEYPDRIPYEHWINSQLSIARFYGGISVNGKRYVIDKETNDLVVPVSRKKRKEIAEKKTKKNLFISDEMNFNP
jgi:hypothetical protein